MRTNREGYKTDGVNRECTRCGSFFPITSKTVTLCKPCNSERVKTSSIKSRMVSRARNRAQKSNMLCDIQANDLEIPTHCPILGIELKVHKGSSGGKPNSPALDRKDSTKGYTKGNIWVISHLANMMKSSATKEEMLKFADWVLRQDWQEVTSPVEHK